MKPNLVDQSEYEARAKELATECATLETKIRALNPTVVPPGPALDEADCILNVELLEGHAQALREALANASGGKPADKPVPAQLNPVPPSRADVLSAEIKRLVFASERPRIQISEDLAKAQATLQTDLNRGLEMLEAVLEKLTPKISATANLNLDAAIARADGRKCFYATLGYDPYAQEPAKLLTLTQQCATAPVVEVEVPTKALSATEQCAAARSATPPVVNAPADDAALNATERCKRAGHKSPPVTTIPANLSGASRRCFAKAHGLPVEEEEPPKDLTATDKCLAARNN